MLLPILVLISLAGLTWQDRDETPRRPKKGDTVTARGCLVRGTLEAAELSSENRSVEYLLPLTYRLTGDKKLVKSLKDEHANHVDILVAVLKTDLPDERRQSGAKIGNTHVGFGVVNPNPTANQQVLPVLEVKRFEHVGVTCR